MLLSKPQKSLIRLLREFGAVREGQAQKLLMMEYQDLRWEPVIRQLESGGMVRREDGCVKLPDCCPEINLLNAIDVMLLLNPKKIELFQKGIPPFSITLFKERNQMLWRYDVCSVSLGREPVINAALEAVNPKYRIMIFILEKPEQQKSLFVPCEHCFSWKEKGKYHFYK